MGSTEGGRWLQAAVLGTIAGVLGLLVVRALYGVDLTDESFYAALAYRFARGDRPLLDEYVAVQGTGALLAPVVRVFAAARGTDGLVLFLRAVYLITVVGTMGIVWRLMRSHTTSTIALLMALTIALSQPFQIPALSYNSLGGMAFTVGCAAGFAARRQPHEARLWVLAGIAHAVCVVAYPTLAVGVLVFVVLTATSLEHKSARGATFAYVGGVSSVAAGVLLMARPAVGAFPNVIAYSSAMGLQGDGWNATVLRLSIIREAHGLRYLLGATAWVSGMIGLLVARRDTLSTWIAACWIISGALLFPRFQPVTASLELMTWLGLGTVVIGLVSCTGTDRSVLSRTVLLPALAGGLATAWSSSNGYITAAVGLLPAVVFLPYVLSRMGGSADDARDLPKAPKAPDVALAAGVAEAPDAADPDRVAQEPESHGPEIDEPRMAAIADAVATAAPAVVTLVVAAALMVPLLQDTGFYRDAPRSKMDCVVAEGPYRGLRTTCARAKDTSALATDLAGLSGSSLAVLGSPPGAYLLGERRIASNATWLTPTALDGDVYQQLFFDYVETSGNTPELVLWSEGAAEWTRIRHWLKSNYEIALVRDEYQLMKLKRE